MVTWCTVLSSCPEELVDKEMICGQSAGQPFIWYWPLLNLRGLFVELLIHNFIRLATSPHV